LETPTGTINSTNNLFTFTNTPINVNTFELYIDDRPVISDDGSGDLNGGFGTIDY
jgi:hypothetical protein